MKFDDPNMEAYFRTLPLEVQGFIERSKADISSPGELMLIGEHFRNSMGYGDEKKK